MNNSFLTGWKQDDFDTLENGVLLAQHGLADTGLFGDHALAQLLDHHPDSDLTISTMGSDPTRFEWIEGDRNGVSGAEIVQLVKDGRLWLNLRNVLKHHPEIKIAVDQIYDTLEHNAPGFRAEDRSANLLVSSSTALVHYHIDMPVNMLWHIRGQKRVWVYPHFDHRFVSQSVVEKVCAGEFSEDVPYSTEFDRYALIFDVEPGQLITWPQLTPHRVQNLNGLCVSLSTEHKNPRARRRINVHQANYFLRNNVGRFHHRHDVEGIVAHMKQALARGLRIGHRLFGEPDERFVYPKQFKINLDFPHGIAMLHADVPSKVPHEMEMEAVS